MKTLSRIAKPCGIAGGVWGVLLAIIYSLFLPTHTVITTTITGQSSIITTTSSESWDWLILAFIILTALMGILGLLAVIMRTKNLGLSRLFIWVSAIVMLVLSFGGAITMVSVGIILLPAAILLILAAIGMGRKEEAVPVEAT
jgi:glucan phosphoethanolaminetransferase (alkaline phosphatase superfamily)